LPSDGPDQDENNEVNSAALGPGQTSFGSVPALIDSQNSLLRAFCEYDESSPALAL
jgi:hypothetical protein